MDPAAGLAAGLVLAAALAVDRLLGDPQSRYHPVALLGRFTGRWGDPTGWDPRLQRLAGAVCGLGTACEPLEAWAPFSGVPPSAGEPPEEGHRVVAALRIAEEPVNREGSGEDEACG